MSAEEMKELLSGLEPPVLPTQYQKSLRRLSSSELLAEFQKCLLDMTKKNCPDFLIKGEKVHFAREEILFRMKQLY